MVEDVGPSSDTYIKARNNKGNFVFIIVKKHERFVIEVKLAVIKKCNILSYFSFKFGWKINLRFSEVDRR